MTDTSRPTDDGMSIFSTLDAFRDGLTLSLPAGATVCRGWAAKIDAAGRPDLGGIRDLLEQLADELADDRAEHAPDGASIGALMQRLGAHTAEVAPTIGQDHLVTPLSRLGAFLSAAGTALAGGARPDAIQGLSTDTGATPGDPELRSASRAPDVSDEALAPDRAGAKSSGAERLGDVAETPGDTTPGTALDPK